MGREDIRGEIKLFQRNVNQFGDLRKPTTEMESFELDNENRWEFPNIQFLNGRTKLFTLRAIPRFFVIQAFLLHKEI